jgi:hypothetical protein
MTFAVHVYRLQSLATENLDCYSMLMLIKVVILIVLIRVVSRACFYLVITSRYKLSGCKSSGCHLVAIWAIIRVYSVTLVVVWFLSYAIIWSRWLSFGCRLVLSFRYRLSNWWLSSVSHLVINRLFVY